jgi:hypothetical protein
MKAVTATKLKRILREEQAVTETQKQLLLQLRGGIAQSVQCTAIISGLLCVPI